MIPGSVKSDTLSPTACHRCDDSSELGSPDAEMSPVTDYTLRHNTAKTMKT